LQAAGWFRGTPRLTVTLTRLGVPAGASRPSAPGAAASVPAARAQGAHARAAHAPAAAPEPAGTMFPAWLIGTIVSAAAIAIAAIALWLRRRSRSSADQAVTDPGGREDEQRAAIP